MVSLNRSFLYGICFASITWAISLYLFWQLTQREALSTPFPDSLPRLKNSKGYLRSNDVLDVDFKENDKEGKSFVRKYFNNFKKNNQKLIKELQPVAKIDKTLSKDDQVLSELGMVKNVEDSQVKDEGYRIHAFNVLVSNQLSLHRDIPDTRNKLCRKQKYSDKLPTTSIIICFYNEHYNTLLRSIHSIIDRTPSNFLHEIILVNDMSDILGLQDSLWKYFNDTDPNKKVKLFRTEKREGLIRARMFGASKASGDVLIFLDSHIEVNVDWIQPMLEMIKKNRTNVVMPVIDVINSDTFSYSSSPLVRGGFNWGLHFKWENLPTGTLVKDEDFIKPIKSPTMAGGLFAIDRKYFIEMGEYDAGMNIWGGENLEISFRIWMCGGKLEIMPCSRVGHVFRQRRPYGSPDGQDTMLHNSLRVANVWMDDYKDHFLKQRKDTSKINYGDISSRIALRKKLHCQDFDWYIKNVYPELALPTDDEKRLKKKWAALEQDKYQPWHMRKRNYVNQYQLKLSNSSLCVQSVKDIKTKGSLLELKSCIRTKAQMWFETDKGELVLAQLLCLQAAQPDPHLYKCHEMGGDQEWKHKSDKQSPIYNLAAGTCLSVRKVEIGAPIVMTLCNEKTFNKWDMVQD